jgi:hypothetical protein
MRDGPDTDTTSTPRMGGGIVGTIYNRGVKGEGCKRDCLACCLFCRRVANRSHIKGAKTPNCFPRESPDGAPRIRMSYPYWGWNWKRERI